VTVHNRHGATATRMQLRVEALDNDWKVIEQKVVWLGDAIAPFDSACGGAKSST
jgi:hypothetical protein